MYNRKNSEHFARHQLLLQLTHPTIQRVPHPSAQECSDTRERPDTAAAPIFARRLVHVQRPRATRTVHRQLEIHATVALHTEAHASVQLTQFMQVFVGVQLVSRQEHHALERVRTVAFGAPDTIEVHVILLHAFSNTRQLCQRIAEAEYACALARSQQLLVQQLVWGSVHVASGDVRPSIERLVLVRENQRR